MNKLSQKALSASAEVVLEVILASLGLASALGSYQEEEPTELLEKARMKRMAEKRTKN